MWEYTDKVTDHFKHPRNVGAVDNPDGEGLVGSLACGDALRLTFKLDDAAKIGEAKFQTFGCASAIASSSALTEMILGKTIEEAETITNKDIIDYLGALPKQKIHCSVMGREALEAAIYNYRTGKTLDKQLDGEVICHCFGATDKEIEKLTREQKLTTAEAVTDACKANGGFYLGSIGGPAARLAQDCIKKVEVLDFDDLGMEAVYKIDVVDFPAFIVVDDKGNDFFAETSKMISIGTKPEV